MPVGQVVARVLSVVRNRVESGRIWCSRRVDRVGLTSVTLEFPGPTVVNIGLACYTLRLRDPIELTCQAGKLVLCTNILMSQGQTRLLRRSRSSPFLVLSHLLMQ